MDVSPNNEPSTNYINKQLMMRRITQIKTMLWLWFSRRAGNSISESQTGHTRREPVVLLTRCNEISMEQFMDCMCDNNLMALCKSGQPTPYELAENFSKVFFEYCDLVEQAEVKYRIRLHNEIELMRKKIEFASCWVSMLELYHNANLSNALKHIGFDYEFNPEDPEQYKYDLARTTAEIRSMRFKLRVKESEYQFILQNQSTTSDVVDRKYFYKLFDSINELKKYAAITEKSTVMQYAIALARMIDRFESKPQSHGK